MEVNPDFDASEVARTVALAVSSLHNRGLSSDNGNDETPLVRERIAEKGGARGEMESQDDLNLVSKHRSRWARCTDCMPTRYVLTLMGFLGFCNVYALRVNLSVAMVAMVNGTAVYTNNSVSSECDMVTPNANETVKEGEFVWSPSTQATILGSFFYGYLVTQIPGGRIAELFGGKWLFGLGIFCTSILTLLTPVVARWSASALIVLRVLEGLGEGVTFPAMHAMLGCWLPKLERSRLSTVIYSGAQIGTVIAMPISGLLCASDFLGGWPSVFYVFGFLGCLWFVFWMWLIYETPDQHPHITKAELLLIQAGKNTDCSFKNKPSIPWKAILTSIPVWTLVITHFGQNWGFYTFLTELPTYFSVILHFNIKSTGFISALPYLLQAICSWITSYIADTVREKQRCSISAIRKTCNTIAFFGPALCLIGVVMAGCHYVWSVFFFSLAMGFNGAIYSGYMVTHVDMSPDFAGTLMGMTNGVATLAGFLAPAVVGALTENNQTLGQWKIVFYIAMAVYFVTGTLFVLFGSAKLQKWGTSDTESLKREKRDGKFSDTD